MSDTAFFVIVITLCVMIAVLGYFLFLALRTILFLREDLQQASDNEHAKCMGAVMRYVGNEWAAQVLDIAAEDYASATSHADLERIRRVKWHQEGPPIPTIWLQERAMRLRIESDWTPEEAHA